MFGISSVCYFNIHILYRNLCTLIILIWVVYNTFPSTCFGLSMLSITLFHSQLMPIDIETELMMI